MIENLTVFLAFSLALICSESLANDRSCWPNEASVNEFVSLKAENKLPMYSRSLEGRFLTNAEFIIQNGPRGLHLSTQFSEDSPPFSNPFHIYAIMVVHKGEVLFFRDYTDGCASPGLSFYPQQFIELGVIKKPIESGAAVQINVWGRL